MAARAALRRPLHSPRASCLLPFTFLSCGMPLIITCGHGQGCLDEAQAGDEDLFAETLPATAADGASLGEESQAFGASLPVEDIIGGGGGQRHGSRGGGVPTAVAAAAAASDDDGDDAGASSGSDDDDDGGGGTSGSCSDDDRSGGDDDEDEGGAEGDDSEDGDDADRNRWVPAPLMPPFLAGPLVPVIVLPPAALQAALAPLHPCRIPVPRLILPYYICMYCLTLYCHTQACTACLPDG